VRPLTTAVVVAAAEEANQSATRTSSSSTSSSSSSSASSTPTKYLVTTKPGTSMLEFNAFILSLPDRGLGTQIAYSAVSFQAYVTKMNMSYATELMDHPLVFAVLVNEELNEEDARGLDRDWESTPFQRRAIPLNLNQMQNSLFHQKQVSRGKVADKADSPFQDYTYEPSLGQGVTIYVIDTGLNIYSHVSNIS
jgi:hypothetical protein